MPKIKPFVPPCEPDANWLLEYGLVHVPGDAKFRCYFCDRVFDTIGETPFGNRVVHNDDVHTGGPQRYACGGCSTKILDAHAAS